MMTSDIPAELLAHVPAGLPEDERAAWLTACRLVVAERQAETAFAWLVQRLAQDHGRAPADVAHELCKRRAVEGVGLGSDPIDEATRYDGQSLARARAQVAARVRDVLEAADEQRATSDA